jgi:hypothetical protein
VGIVPHALAVVAVAVELLAAAELEELDELEEQAARPRLAVRARAAMPPVCTALIYVSFDTVVT